MQDAFQVKPPRVGDASVVLYCRIISSRIFGKRLAMLGLSLALMLGVFSIPAGAHFMWINAGDYTPPTERPVKFTIGWGHAFASPVGNVMYKQGGLDKIYLLDPDGNKLRIKPINEIQFKVETPLKKAGAYLAVATRKEGFSTKTTEGHKRQSKKGLKDVIQCSYSGMYAKAIVDVEKGGERTSPNRLAIPLR